MAKPQRRAVSPLRGEVRPQKRFCPLQTFSPHSKPSQPPLGAWRAGRVHPHLFSVWQLGDALSFPRYSPSFRHRRAACVGTQSILPCSVRTWRGFTATGRGQTAKAFLPASNVLSLLIHGEFKAALTERLREPLTETRRFKLCALFLNK